MHRPKLVIIGNGMACCRLLDELVQLAPGRHDIEVFGSEATGGYNRILLSPLVAGQLGPQDIELHTSDWYEEHGILRHCGEAIVEINRETRTLTSSKGRQVHYDQLVVATGSRARVPEIPGTDLSGVRVLRTLDDADALIGQTRDDSGKRFVVAGGGLLGLEAAWGLRQRGAKVTVVHNSERLMNRQLDHKASDILYHQLRACGIEFVMNARLASLSGPGRIESIQLADGHKLDADVVLFAIGIVPETSLACASGLDTAKAVVVDAQLRTSDPRVFALGECSEFQGQTFGTVEPIYRQAAVLARVLTGDEQAKFGLATTPTQLKISGMPLFSSGAYVDDSAEEMAYLEPDRGTYRKLSVRDGRLVGVLLLGDTSDALWYQELIDQSQQIDRMRDILVFGRAFAESAEQPGGVPCLQ